MVLIRHSGGAWHEPETSKYENEKAMQDLVKLSPSLLPGEELLAVVDELSLPDVGFVDLVGVGADGRIVIVECKLRANPEIRREVIGQVLAYAGGMWRMNYDAFDAAFSARAKSSLYETVKNATATELDAASFRDAVSANLAAGSFRLVVVVDEITSELRTIIEFLNGHTLENVQVLALELRYSRDGDVELLTPVVYGADAAESKDRTGRTKWTETTFAEELERRCSPSAAALLKQFIAHGAAKGHHFFYGSGVTPGMSCYYEIDGVPTSVWAIYLYEGNPCLSLSFGSIAAKGRPELAFQLAEALRGDPQLSGAIAGITVDNVNKYPQFSAAMLAAGTSGELILSAVDALVS